MSESIVEHNDVDISPLFAWSKEFEVTSDGVSTPVFMRLLGDADMNRARVAALRQSAELRRRLRDENSDERLAYIKDIEDIDIESLIAVVAVFSMNDLAEKAKSKLKIKVPKAPRSNAKTSAHEKYQEEIDSFSDRRQAELRELITKEVEILRNNLLKEPKEVVYKKYVASMVDKLCEDRLLSEFKSQCCYYGTYANQDLTVRLFSSYDEFDNLRPSLKEQFIEEYSTLELQGEDLKKLQRVTQ